MRRHGATSLDRGLASVTNGEKRADYAGVPGRCQCKLATVRADEASLAEQSLLAGHLLRRAASTDIT